MKNSNFKKGINISNSGNDKLRLIVNRLATEQIDNAEGADCSSHTHEGFSPPELRMPWSISSGDQSERSHSSLNQCSQSQRWKATLFLESPLMFQGEEQVVASSDKDRSFQDFISNCLIYKLTILSLSNPKNISGQRGWR